LVKNGLVEAILILPQNMFYTTNISVTLWIINKNKSKRIVKQAGHARSYRDRKDEVLFMDLREVGVPFEKKFIQFSQENIQRIASTFHRWQCEGSGYENVAEYCYSASKEEIKAKDYSLVPSKYIEFVNKDEQVDFKQKMISIQTEMRDLLKAEQKSKIELLSVFKELGYDIEL
jgi:type I restriction enzyme M protein